MSGTTWSWCHDGKNCDGTVYFSKEKQVRFKDRPLSGYWKQAGNTLEFAVLPEIDIIHTLNIVNELEAVLIKPKRTPPTKMKGK